MNSNPKKKLCWNCEGSIPLHEERCPYCGSDGTLVEDLDRKEMASGLQPPFKLSGLQANEALSSPFNKRLQSDPAAEDPDPPNESQLELLQKDEFEDDAIHTVATMGFLIAGTIFFLFGWVLLFFSSNGRLELSWNADYWYVYLAIGGPFLFWGIKNLGQFQSDPEDEETDEAKGGDQSVRECD